LTPLPLSDAFSAFPSEARPHRCHQTMDVLVHANPCCWLWPTLLSAKSWLSWFTNHNTTGPTTTKSEDVFLQHIFRRLTSVTYVPHLCKVWLLDHYVKCPCSILMWSVTIISAFVTIITNGEIIVTLFIVTQVCQAHQRKWYKLQKVLKLSGYWINVMALREKGAFQTIGSQVLYYPFTKEKVIQWRADLIGGLSCWNMQSKWWKGSLSIEFGSGMRQIIYSSDLWKIKEHWCHFYSKTDAGES